MKRGQERCECRFADDPVRVARLVELFGVSDQQADIAARRFKIRKRLEAKRGILCGVVGGSLLVFGGILGDILDPQSFTDYVVHTLMLMAVLAPCAFAVQRWLLREENRLLRDELKQAEDGPSHSPSDMAPGGDR